MKRPMLCILLLVPIACAWSQALSPGFRVGYSITGIDNSRRSNVNYDTRKSFYAGLSLTRAVNRIYALQAEINYAPQGAIRRGMQPVNPEDLQPVPPGNGLLFADYAHHIRVSYLELPVLLKASLNNGHTWHYYVFAGPYVGVLLKATQVRSGYGYLYTDDKGLQRYQLPDGTLPGSYSFTGERDIARSFKTMNTGLTGAAGLCFMFKKQHFSIESRFNMGLVNIRKSAAEEMRTTSVIIILSYTFGAGLN